MSYIRYLCLFVYSGVQRILCCVFVVVVCLRIVSCLMWCPTHIALYFLICLSSHYILCTQCCQFLWIVHS
jgi:hypothetical protein